MPITVVSNCFKPSVCVLFQIALYMANLTQIANVSGDQVRTLLLTLTNIIRSIMFVFRLIRVET